MFGMPALEEADDIFYVPNLGNAEEPEIEEDYAPEPFIHHESTPEPAVEQAPVFMDLT